MSVSAVSPQKPLEEMKMDFVLSVFDAINKQIHQTDLKTSLIISWDGIIAVMLGREVGQMFGAQGVTPFTLALAALCIVFLGLSGYFIFWTLRPRARVSQRDDFTGILYAGDILRLARGPSERIAVYMAALASLRTPEEIQAQFVNSIVAVSDISQQKNRAFQRALLFTSISFGFLVVLIAIVSILTDERLKAIEEILKANALMKGPPAP